MTLEEIKRRKAELGITNDELSRRSGVPLGTVQKVLAGATKSPRYDTLMALEKVLSPEVFPGPAWDCYGAAGRAVWDRQGEYTLKDYYTLPDEKRVELIDGVFYDMSSPRTDHQLIAGQIYAVLLNYITSKGGNCIPFIAPCDVNLDRDDRTMVQPDVMVICDRQNIRTRIISGAPDLAIEVLSPSTRKKDMILKLHKYSHAGVREYWIVDPAAERVIVYPLEEEDFIRIYSFDDKIPVEIFGGDCVIDFNTIKNYIAFLKDARDYEEKDAPPRNV